MIRRLTDIVPTSPSTRVPTRRFALRCAALLLILVAAAASLPMAAVGESYSLVEPASDARSFAVTCRLTVNGNLQTSIGGDKAVALKLEADAHIQYRERQLSGTGRGAEALRSIRDYSQAQAEITVSQQQTNSRLRDERRLIVVQGSREGPVLYCPKGMVRFSELELLRVPGDSLAALGLLPESDVEVGSTWKPQDWVLPMLAGVEAVTSSELTCRLESCESPVAKVAFSGKIEGATLGATTVIEVSGHYTFDIAKKHMTALSLTQKEKRSVGAVSPGVDVTAQLTFERAIAESHGVLTDQLLAQIPLEPPADLMLVRLESPWNVSLTHDRNWHVFHQTRDVAVLRLLDQGSLIAQCNLSPVPAVEPGTHTPEDRFQADIRESLGKTLKSITKAEQIKTNDGRFLYRVTAVGAANGIAMNWHYYLCTSPSGKQISLVFAVETELLDRLANRDLGIVHSIDFLPVKRVSAKTTD